MFFLHAEVENVATLKNVLAEYEALAGQKVNFLKSEVVFSGSVPQEKRRKIREVLRVKEVEAISNYLGMTVNCSLKRSERFKGLVETIWNKLTGWNVSNLSVAGKATLIKAVVQAMPTYVMSCFKLPVSLVKRIASIITTFWWSYKEKGKGIHWCKYKDLCKDVKAGGLNFKDLTLFNTAMLGKQFWRLLVLPNSLLGRLFKAKYFRHCSLDNSSLGQRPSLAWRSIWEYGMEIKQHVCRNGNDQSWRWLEEVNGICTVRSAYAWLVKSANQKSLDLLGDHSDKDKVSSFWGIILKLDIQPKEKFFAWRVFHNFVSSVEQLAKRGMEFDLKCTKCGFAMESSMYVLTNCWWARAFWKQLDVGLEFLDHGA